MATACAAACLAKLLSLDERYGELACSPPDGSWSLVQVGGLNQYGEPFATMYLDSVGWGGGAFSFRDGVDSRPPGGYGDPIERDPEAVLADVRRGSVTAGTAAQVYGVVLGDGDIDQAATERRRQSIRDRRLADLAPAPQPTIGATPGSPLLRWGDVLRIGQADGQLALARAACGISLGRTSGNWRDVVPVRHPSPDELGPHVWHDERFRFDQLICTGCARSLWIDVQHLEAPRTNDFSLL